MLQNATPLRKSAPGPPNSSDEHVLYCACHAKCIFAHPLQMSHTCHRFWTCYKTLTLCSLFARCAIPCACHAKTTSEPSKWSEHVVLLAFWPGNVLRAATACTFSTSEPPKVVRAWCVLYILTWQRALRHNGVHFFDIATSKSGPKNTVLRDFLTFSRTWIFFLLAFSSLIFFLLPFSSLTLPISAFHLTILSEVWLINRFRLKSNSLEWW